MKHGRKIFTLILLISVCIFSCVKENYFGKSKLKQILLFSIENQSGNTRILQDSLSIYLTVANDANIHALVIDSILLSTFASISPDPKQSQDFSKPFTYKVTAEDGSSVNYTVFVSKETGNPQLENSGFDDWYIPEGKLYKQPGKDANTIWASANEGVTTTGSNKFNTAPVLIAGTDFAAQLVTKDLGAIAQITRQRMGAATLFTGKFVLNIINPSLSAQFGIPFQARPSAFSIEYNYKAGTPYKDGSNNVINKPDSADIYVLLENRSDLNAIKRIATGWLRTASSDNTSYKKATITLIYGQLPGATPAYQKPQNGLYGSTADVVTHISVVFASSANGINYEGGVNSTLLLNNFSLVY
ncbi:PCMD domain-containing protein [Pedobacter foliorum]|uniref:PCMD domain-containing protein n=1 Tax=Pedobacter foliorum TaxID=2739058 RepID=UPI001563D10E|nr:PCMD domain-containing protein [Pedobacter foliorum]NRF38190.1 PCMD domain-containing protein [Pedobacter foliorum]